MFEHKTFESILQDMLDDVSDDVDKREGSIIYDALAPAAMRLAENYQELDVFLRLTFADTSSGEYLQRRTAEYGVRVKLATKAIRKGTFTDTSSNPLDVAIGTEFRLGDIVYVVTERIAEGEFKLRAETTGTIGNLDFGELLPIEALEGLGIGELMDVIVPGEDEEEDDELYARYLNELNAQPFGGNRDDYKEKILGIEGVGAVKLFRAPEGGGTVRATILDSSFNVASQLLVDSVQVSIDPLESQGEGLGIAPIGHSLTVKSATVRNVSVQSSLTLAAGTTIGQVQPLVEEVLGTFFLNLRKSWKDEPNAIVRISQIEAQILTVSEIVDISNTLLNDTSVNISLDVDEVPFLNGVVLNG